MSDQLKPFKTYAEQLAILKSRGLIVNDDDYALCFLQDMNYYRFSGYTYLRMNRTNNTFFRNTTFDSIANMVKFDDRLRYLILPLVESIELSLRCQIAYCFSSSHNDKNKYPNNDAHYYAENFSDLREHEGLFSVILPHQIDQHKSDLFVQRHIKGYNGRMPLWCIVEILSFSQLSRLYRTLLSRDQDQISKVFNSTAHYMGFWIETVVVLRNKCAHYGRLYSTEFKPPVILPDGFKRKNPAVKNTHFFAAIYIALVMAPRSFDKDSFISGLDALVSEYSSIITLEEMSFPKNWKTVLLSTK